MTKSYKKICDYCQKQIEMSDKSGKWVAYNLDNGPHDCRDKDRPKQDFTLEAVLQKFESIGMKIDLDKLMNQK